MGQGWVKFFWQEIINLRVVLSVPRGIGSPDTPPPLSDTCPLTRTRSVPPPKTHARQEQKANFRTPLHNRPRPRSSKSLRRRVAGSTSTPVGSTTVMSLQRQSLLLTAPIRTDARSAAPPCTSTSCPSAPSSLTALATDGNIAASQWQHLRRPTVAPPPRHGSISGDRR